MRVLLVSSGSGSRGGGEIFLRYLGKGLKDRGHEVLIWMPSHPRMDELAEQCSDFAQVIRAHYHNTYDHAARSLATCFNWLTSKRIAREWEELKPVIVHLNKQNLEDGLDLLRATRHCSIPSICTIHLTQNARYLRAKVPRLRNWIARDALRKYGGVLVAVQEARRAALWEFVGNGVRTCTIFNGVPIPERDQLCQLRKAKRKELGLDEDELLVLGLGRLVEQKRPLLFLETARDLKRGYPATRFLWIGDGRFSPRWDDWVTREGLGDVISRIGWQSNVLPFLSAGDLLLHVAEYEGLPLAVIEAMAAGLPCAVTRELVREVPVFDESKVLLFDDGATLAKQLRDRAGMATLATNGLRLVEEKLSLKTMTTAYEQLYRDIAHGH